MYARAISWFPWVVLLSWSWVGSPAPAAERTTADLRAVRDGAAASADAGLQLEALDPFLLTNLVSSRVVVEIDWVSGFEPSPKAVRAIEDVLEEHCEPGKQVEILLDTEIPRGVWEASAGRAGLESLVARHLDGDPTDWDREEIVYVLYAPDGRPWYGRRVSGMAERIDLAREDRLARVRVILLFTDEIRRDALLWITPAKVERATLVHELGHLMGLVANPVHEQWKHPRHCRVARCVMHQPGGRARWVNGLPALLAGRIPSRFGKQCSGDLATARQLWQERAAASPEFVRRLRAARILHEAAAAGDRTGGSEPR